MSLCAFTPQSFAILPLANFTRILKHDTFIRNLCQNNWDWTNRLRSNLNIFGRKSVRIWQYYTMHLQKAAWERWKANKNITLKNVYLLCFHSSSTCRVAQCLLKLQKLILESRFSAPEKLSLLVMFIVPEHLLCFISSPLWAQKYYLYYNSMFFPALPTKSLGVFESPCGT